MIHFVFSSFSACIFTPLLTTVNILLEGILYFVSATVNKLLSPSTVAWKVLGVKEMKSVLTVVSFKILKEPVAFASLPTSSKLIFYPF
ncbi:MAG: hypothetical protein WDO16_15345 [Bacteroidota bacterium]